MREGEKEKKQRRQTEVSGATQHRSARNNSRGIAKSNNKLMHVITYVYICVVLVCGVGASVPAEINVS